MKMDLGMRPAVAQSWQQAQSVRLCWNHVIFSPVRTGPPVSSLPMEQTMNVLVLHRLSAATVMQQTHVVSMIHASMVAIVPLFPVVLFVPVCPALQEKDASYSSILVMVSCVKMVALAWLQTH